MIREKLMEARINQWLEKVNYLFTLDKEKDNLITLEEFAVLLKNYYELFNREYEDLEKLDIGDNNNILEYRSDPDGFRALRMIINEQNEKTIVPKGKRCNLTIIDVRGNVHGFFEDTVNIFTETEDIDDSYRDVLKSYIDLFGKYYPLFDLCRLIELNSLIYRYKDQYLNIIIDKHNGSLINGLDGIEFRINSFTEFGNKYAICIYVDLKDDIKIDFNKSYIASSSDNVNNDKSYITSINKNIDLDRATMKKLYEKALSIPFSQEYLRGYTKDDFKIENGKVKVKK